MPFYYIVIQIGFLQPYKNAVVRGKFSDPDEAFHYYHRQALQKFGKEVNYFDCLPVTKRSPLITEYLERRYPMHAADRADQCSNGSKTKHNKRMSSLRQAVLHKEGITLKEDSGSQL